MKLYFQFIFGLLAVLLMAGFLSLSYFQPAKPEPAHAAIESSGLVEIAENDFSQARCDRIIPIGQPMEDTVRLLAQVFSEQQNAGRYMESASADLQNVFAQLNKDSEFICDFSNCSPVFADVGPEFTLELDALVKKFSIGGHAPIPSDKECAGSPCPDLGDAENGYIGSLRGWLTSLQESSARVEAVFDEDEPSITVTEDLAIYESEVGEKITKAEAIRRLAERAAVMVKECTLSGLEEKRVLAGRMGAKYPMSCPDAIALGEYWPMPWSEVCKEECKGEDSDKCYKCLENEPVNLKDLEEKTSILGKINYKIYQQCREKCKDPVSGDWGLSQACQECLCTDYKYTFDYYTLQTILPTLDNAKIETKEMTDAQCLDWLCGGSSHNWVCCHEGPIDIPNYDMVPHHSELGPGSESYGPELVGGETGGGVPVELNEPPVGPGEEMVLTAYAPPCFCEGGCTSQQNNVGFGIMAVDKKNIPYKSRVWIISDFQDGKFDKATKTYNRLTGAEHIYESFKVDGQEIANGAMSFCACDTGGDIKNRRIDVWMPDETTANDFGVKFANVSWQPDPTCCTEKEICCQNPKAAGCQEIGNGLRCPDEPGCCKEAPSEWSYLFKRFGGTCP